MNRKPLGSPVRSDMKRNCMLCSRWVACRDPNKKPNYACSNFSTEYEFSLKDLFEQEEDEARTLVKTRTGLQSPLDSHSGGALTVRSNKYYNSDININVSLKEDEDGELVEVNDGSFESIVNEVLNSGVPVPPDLRVDDRHIPRPKNIVDWITQEKFVGGDSPFGKQIQIMTHFLAEWCPNCSDEDYFDNVPVADRVDDIKEKTVFLKNGVCPKCRLNKVQLIEDHDLKDPFQMIGIVGQRGSKTISATMIESYNLMRWLTVPNIPATYKIKSSTILFCTYTATTFNQVKENFWQPFDALINGSEWFREYHKFLDHTGRKHGEELYKHSETLLAYRHKNIFSSPASPSQRALRGRTRASAAIDEAGWFKVGKTKGGADFERMNGTEVYTALHRSLTTLRSAYMRRREAGYHNLPKPLMTLISSPSARNDLIMTKFRETQNSPETYSFMYKTWEFNPLIKRSDLNEDFRARPVESERDFACNPPMAANPWIADEDLVSSSFSGKKNAIRTITRRFRTKSKKLVTSASIKHHRENKQPYGGVMGLDAGWNNNSFAIAIAYPTTIPDPDEEDEEDIFVGVEIPVLIEIIPKKEYPVSFTGVYNEIIKPLCDMFNVALVVSDRWQNKKIVQDLDDALGVDYAEIKLTLNDFDDYKQCIYDEMIVHPELDMDMETIVNMSLDNYPDCFAKHPVAHLAFQMLTVQNTGNAVVKGEDGTTDDLLRACVIAHAALQDEELLEVSLSKELNAMPEPTAAIAGMAGISAKYGIRVVQNIGTVASMGSRGGSIGASSGGIAARAARR